MEYKIRVVGAIISFIDENGKEYYAYKCKRCNQYTPHQYVGIMFKNRFYEKQPYAIYKCKICEEVKEVYIGYKRPKEISGMTT